MPISTYFIQQCCDRCGGQLNEKRTMSFLTGETLCERCSANEQETREKVGKQKIKHEKVVPKKQR
jgi:recombinational DNA repair protein (RecF pathway)